MTNSITIPSPAASVIEEIASQWIKELLHLTHEVSFAFTTGCQMEHMTALAAARFAVLKRHGWNIEKQGLFDAPAIHLLANDQKHGSVVRAARFLGLGRQSFVHLETNNKGQVTPAVLRHALNRVTGPLILILNAADLNIGACDPFKELIPIAHQAGAWMHINGAFGLFARTSKTYRHLVDVVDGIELTAAGLPMHING